MKKPPEQIIFNKTMQRFNRQHSPNHENSPETEKLSFIKKFVLFDFLKCKESIAEKNIVRLLLTAP